MSETTFSQNGVIEQISDDSIIVRIDCNSACSACHSKDLCISTDKAVKHITIEPDGNIYSIGQQVTVYSQKQLAMKALFWGYLFPLIILITALITLICAGVSEGKAGILSILTLAPYYLALYLLRDRFRNKFKFKIKI